MTIYDRVLALAKGRGVSMRTVESACGLSHGVIRRWTDRHPSADRLKSVAEYFGVSVNFLLGEEDEPEYYIDSEVVQIAQTLKDRPELKALFDASRKMSKETVESLIKFINAKK